MDNNGFKSRKTEASNYYMTDSVICGAFLWHREGDLPKTTNDEAKINGWGDGRNEKLYKNEWLEKGITAKLRPLSRHSSNYGEVT